MRKRFPFSLLIAVFCSCLLPASLLAQVNPNFTYTQTCYGNQTTLVASSSLADTAITSWLWDLDGNGTYEKSGKIIIPLITTYSNTVALKIVPHTGAADSITKTVIIDPLPQVNFIANNLCAGKKATYISQSTVSPGSITQFKWDFDNNGTDDDTGDSVSYTCGPAQTYVTKLTCVSNKGCSAFAQKTTTVYPVPTASFTFAGLCQNSQTAFTNNSTAVNLDYYLWKFGDGNNQITSGNTAHSYSATGTYSVQLIAVTQAGCRDSTSSPVAINTAPAISITGNAAVCAFSSATLIATGGASYAWNTGATTASILVQPLTATAYSVTGTDAKGCTNTAAFTVSLYPAPLVLISNNLISGPGDITLSAGSSVMLIANGAHTYSWSTGETTNYISVSQSGYYTLYGTDLNGCSGADSIEVLAQNPDVLTVSGQILTPNGDNINDALVLDNISQYANCNLNVYNMWNDEVYSVKGYKNDWKGTNSSGAELPAGSYYYIIKCDDKPLLKGNINILR